MKVNFVKEQVRSFSSRIFTTFICHIHSDLMVTGVLPFLNADCGDTRYENDSKNNQKTIRSLVQ